ncbi:MAG: adenylyl-sulfate kinase [Candidatus Marinimicrobia bacterium]|nr:adenylyl-sulfate kinase [Candidatus Neomarinimicrobiota bacterium]
MKSSHITWQTGEIDIHKREKLLQQKGVCLWFTGLSGSGKTTIARAVEKSLFERGYHSYVLDGDNIRYGLNGDLGFSAEDRRENIRRIGEVSKLFVDAGIITLTAFISPFRADRDAIRHLMESGRFIEIYVKCPMAVCEKRDVKGLYAKARRNEIEEFTGISSPYEAPENAEIVINTDSLSAEASLTRIIDYLIKNHIIEEK